MVWQGLSNGLDENMDKKLEIHFNITLLDLECDLVSVDVWDILGTNLQNITKNVEKWQTDAESCGKSVFSPHLVGFHSSRQNMH